MTNISRRKLPKHVWEQIYSSFAENILSQNGISGRRFLGDLFTSTERVMFAKRLAVIVFSLEKMSAYRITEILNMSSSTVLSIRTRLNRGGFENIRSYFEKKKNREKFWSDIGTILRLGMPPYAGPRRNRWLRNLDKRISKNPAIRPTATYPSG